MSAIVVNQKGLSTTMPDEMPLPPHGDVERIAVRGPRLDGGNAKRLLADGEAAIAAGARAVVLDMSRVVSLDSLGISGLILLQRRAPAGVRVVLAGLNEQARMVARITRLHEVFDIYADSTTAMLALRSS